MKQSNINDKIHKMRYRNAFESDLRGSTGWKLAPSRRAPEWMDSLYFARLAALDCIERTWKYWHVEAGKDPICLTPWCRWQSLRCPANCDTYSYFECTGHAGRTICGYHEDVNDCIVFCDCCEGCYDECAQDI